MSLKHTASRLFLYVFSFPSSFSSFIFNKQTKYIICKRACPLFPNRSMAAVHLLHRRFPQNTRDAEFKQNRTGNKHLHNLFFLTFTFTSDLNLFKRFFQTRAAISKIKKNLKNSPNLTFYVQHESKHSASTGLFFHQMPYSTKQSHKSRYMMNPYTFIQIFFSHFCIPHTFLCFLISFVPNHPQDYAIKDIWVMLILLYRRFLSKYIKIKRKLRQVMSVSLLLF